MGVRLQVTNTTLARRAAARHTGGTPQRHPDCPDPDGRPDCAARIRHGSEAQRGDGHARSMIAAVAGGFILSCIAASAAVVGARSRLSSYQLVLAAFGYRGGKLVNACLSVVMVGWFAVVASLFGDAALRAAGGLVRLNASTWVAIGCVLMTATTLTGFRALDILAMLTTPLKVILLIATVVASWTLTHGTGLWAARPPSIDHSPRYFVRRGWRNCWRAADSGPRSIGHHPLSGRTGLLSGVRRRPTAGAHSNRASRPGWRASRISC